MTRIPPVEQMSVDELAAALQQLDRERLARELEDLRGNTPISKRIRAFFARCNAPVSAAQLADELAEDPHTVYVILRQMPEVERFKDGRRIRFALREHA